MIDTELKLMIWRADPYIQTMLVDSKYSSVKKLVKGLHLQSQVIHKMFAKKRTAVR